LTTEETISLLGQFPIDRLLDIVSAESVYPRAFRLEAARMVKARSPLTRYARNQMANAADAEQMKTPTAAQTAGIATYVARTFSSQYDRKVQIRTESDPEFARMMEEANR
jgi:hypothetical protein